MFALITRVFFSMFASFGNSTSHVVISEVLPVPSASQGHFIELYNPTGVAVDISSWQIHTPYASILLPGEAQIAPYSYMLLGQLEENWPASWIKPDYYYTELGIVNGSCGLRLIDDSGVLIDTVGWGGYTEGYYEGTPLGAASTANSFERKSGAYHNEGAGNSRDTNNNQADFLIRLAPQPQSTVSPAERPGSGVENTGWGMIKAIYMGG